MDKATIDPEALDEVLEASALLHDPPEGMLAALSWEEDDGPVTMVSLWESPGARGQAAMERMMPLFETGLLGRSSGTTRPPKASSTCW